MNVILTDVKAPTPTPSSRADKTSDSGKDSFRSMMQENLRAESKNKPQLVENTENNKISDDSTGDTGLSSKDSLVPDSRLEYVVISDTGAITEGLSMVQSSDEIAKSELLSNVVTPISSDIKAKTTLPVVGETFPVVGEILPVNGNSLPLLVEQSRSLGSVSSIGTKDLQQATSITALVQNIADGPNGKININNTTKFDTSSPVTSSDLMDSLIAKTFELNASQQMSSDSSSTRLQAAMAAINGVQNSSVNPGTPSPLGSPSVLSNSLERMVMTNPDSSAQWSSGLGERVSLMLNQKHNAATIRLDPPMLGKMDIMIQVKDDVTTVTINTQHSQTRDMVDGASNRLREILQDAGYQNVNVDVSHQRDQQKNDAQFMGEPGSNNGLDSDQASSADELVMTAQASVSNSLIDYFA